MISLPSLPWAPPGERSLETALTVAMELADSGFWISLERASAADESGELSANHLRYLIEGLVGAGIAPVCEVVAGFEALGDRRDELARIAQAAGVELTVASSADVAQTLSWAAAMASSGVPVGVVIEAAMRRSEADCGLLAGQRVRLLKGGARSAAEPLFSQPLEVDKSFVRCARVLLAGSGRPSFATRDDRLIEIVDALAVRAGRSQSSYEVVVPADRRVPPLDRMPALGGQLRIWVPYGPGSSGGLVGGFAEQPRTLAAAVRSLLPGA